MKTSNARSAACRSSPLPSSAHPISYAVVTVCPASARRSGAGVPWSRRTLTTTGASACAESRLDETLLRVLEDGLDLIPPHARKPLEKLVHSCTVLEVLEERLDGDACALEQPGSANLAGSALDGRAPTPV